MYICPCLSPKAYLKRKKDHVEGFAPEVAWVTYGGLNPFRRECVSDLPLKHCSVIFIRMISSLIVTCRRYITSGAALSVGKETRPFLRSREFLWQEGHTAHATAEEAQARTEQMLNVYADFCEEVLAIPVIKGRKTEKEKFAGAEATYTIEALMHDGKALQSEPATTLVTALQKHSESSLQTRITN